jgi:hypothetical protein
MNLALTDSARLPAVARGRSFPWFSLLGRLVLFAAFQAVIAVGLALSGRTEAWRASAAWWLLTAVVTNVVSIALLWRRAWAGGRSLRSLYQVDGRHMGRDVLALLGVLVTAAPMAQLPNLVLAKVLFGDPQRALEMFVQPLPLWAAVAALVLFPLTIPFSELPTYYADALPRLEAWGLGRFQALAVAAFFHSAQHATLPLLFDARFFTWRLFMFLPFALVVGGAVRWRPSLLPWLMGVHGLLDASAGWLVLAASR